MNPEGSSFSYVLHERIKHTFKRIAFWKHYEEVDIPLPEKGTIKLIGDIFVNYFAFLMSRLLFITSLYGESVWRVIFTALSIIAIYTGIYSAKGGIVIKNGSQPIHNFLTNLYFSIVTFTTLGYGDLHPVAHTWMRLTAGSEAFLGAFLLAYFVVVVSRKIMR